MRPAIGTHRKTGLLSKPVSSGSGHGEVRFPRVRSMWKWGCNCALMHVRSLRDSYRHLASFALRNHHMETCPWPPPSAPTSCPASPHPCRPCAPPTTPTIPTSAPRSRPSASSPSGRCTSPPPTAGPTCRPPERPACLTMTRPSRHVWTHQIKRDHARPRHERRPPLTFHTVLNQDGFND